MGVTWAFLGSLKTSNAGVFIFNVCFVELFGEVLLHMMELQPRHDNSLDK